MNRSLLSVLGPLAPIILSVLGLVMFVVAGFMASPLVGVLVLGAVFLAMAYYAEQVGR